jgi:hypothetical protein
VLYRNNGDGTFTDATEGSGIAGQHLSSSAAFADFDRDGTLDLYVVTYLDFEAALRVCRTKEGRPVTCHPRAIAAAQDLMYQNRGDGSFQDVTDAAGIVAPEGKGLGVVAADFDQDGWTDIYVANDTTPNFLYHNRGRPSADDRPRLEFEEIGVVSGSALCGDGQAKAGMGIACADLDGNGYLDLYVTNYYREYNTLFLNFGNLTFRDETQQAGLVAPTLPVLGFGTQAIDADLDGWPDLFVANGHVEDVRERGDPWKMPAQFFRNQGQSRFADESHASGDYFSHHCLGRGASRLDWDRDGRSDLVVVNQDRPAGLLHNQSEIGNRIVIELCGVRSNRDATGSRIVVMAGGKRQVIESAGGDGYLGTNERRQIIGLGGTERIDSIEVYWPSGWVNEWRDLEVNRNVTIRESSPPLLELLP